MSGRAMAVVPAESSSSSSRFVGQELNDLDDLILRPLHATTYRGVYRRLPRLIDHIDVRF